MKYIRVKKTEGQNLINLIRKSLNKTKKIINPNYKIEYEGNFILFPIITENLKPILSKLTKMEYEIIERNGNVRIDQKERNIRIYLDNILPKRILKLIPKSYDLIGDIIVIEFDRLDKIKDPDILLYKKKIAEALLYINKSVRSIYEKKSEISGAFRLRNLNLILGDDDSETLHKENKTLYKLDVKKVFFSPRLGYERKRISEGYFNDNEMIVDMFAGVGPFSIQIAKKNQVKIFAFDINPIAFKYMKENVKINKLKDKIMIYNFDVKELLKPDNHLGNMIHNQIDRIIMNLPEMSFNYLDVTCFLMKNSGGILHFYSFVDKKRAFKATHMKLKKKLDEYQFEIKRILSKRIVKAYSPKMDLIVVDCEIKSKD